LGAWLALTDDDEESEDLFKDLVPTQPFFMLLGDRSSGKSTVVQHLVETLIGSTFPQLSEPTTCMMVYALRPHPQKLSRVYITPDDSAPTEEYQYLDEFLEEEEGYAALHDNIMKALALMQSFEHEPSQLLPHMVVACITGPGLPCMNIIDLPGLVQLPNQHRSQEDIDNMTWMLSDTASYLLPVVVVPGNTDYAQAEALKIAKEHDPKGERTIGLITKPDFAEAVALVGHYTDLINGHDVENTLPLGWVLGPNLGNAGKENGAGLESSYWDKSVWRHNLPSWDNYGIQALIKAFCAMVCRYYAAEMPGRLADIETALQTAEKEEARCLNQVLKGCHDFLDMMKEDQVHNEKQNVCSDLVVQISPWQGENVCQTEVVRSGESLADLGTSKPKDVEIQPDIDSSVSTFLSPNEQSKGYPRLARELSIDHTKPDTDVIETDWVEV
jgi:hypothetical protein